MNKEQLKRLEDKAARVVMGQNNTVIEIWKDNTWVPTYFYLPDEYDKCIVKIMQLEELKFDFEDMLIR